MPDAAVAEVRLSSPVTDASPSHPADPLPRPSFAWAVAQLVPSPEIVGGSDGAYAGLRWQVTPLLVSYGLRAGLRPWRTFVVEPSARHAGSTELFVAPEYFFHGDAAERWSVRPGLRTYLPLYQRGEYASLSLGTSYFHTRGHDGAAFELGAYALYGVFGAVVTYSPSFAPTRWMATLNVRFF